MAEEFWKTSPFGEDSIFAPGWVEKQKQLRLQEQQNGEIVGISIDNGDLRKKLIQNPPIYDNLYPAKYRHPIYNIPPIESKTKTVTITVSVSVKGYAESVYISIDQNKQRASKELTNYMAVFDIDIPKKESKKKFEITAQITDFTGNTVFDTKKLLVTIDLSGEVLESKIVEESLGTGNWFVNHKTGEFTWFDDKTKRDGHTKVGHYKLVYNKAKNIINVYAGKESTFIKSLDMSTDTSGKYKTDQAVKFALISAELGGSYVTNDDPTVQPLVIGASIDNRLKLYGLGVTQYSSDGTIQTIKGYQATTYKSYKDFKYGNNERYGLGESAYQKKNMNIGLSAVYTATLDAVSVLNEYYSVPKGSSKQFEQILYYAHGSGNTINGDFDVAIPEGTNGKFQYVRGSNKYKQLLSPQK
jgi:hypothetical protein